MGSIRSSQDIEGLLPGVRSAAKMAQGTPPDVDMEEEVLPGIEQDEEHGGLIKIDASELSRDDRSVVRDPSAGLERLGKDMMRLQASIRHLRELGVEDLVETLPRIVAVGDQSHGKSSLIEAISEIKVPRNEGACTRCPMEINLSGTTRPNAPWTCKIALRQSYIYNPPSRNSRTAANGSPSGPGASNYGHFTPQDTKDYFFAITQNKDELQHLIECAQHATLNPSADPRTFHPDNYSNVRDSFDVKFSPNVVRLEIVGPNLPMLTFYDLPGVINRLSKAEDNHLISMVEQLVQDYVQSESSLILMTQSMTEDPSNSRAGKIVADMQAEARCLGVLTKPDRCPPESFLQWEEVLNGENFVMGHGYFITKQPSQQDLDAGISHGEARAQERVFFESARWRGRLSRFANKYGTESLQEALSEKLSQQIKESLPDINSRIQVKLSAIREELAEFPAPPGRDLYLKVVRQLELFRRCVLESVDGGHSHDNFQRVFNSVAQQFRRKVIQARPVLVFGEAQQDSQSSNASDRGTPVRPRHAKETIDLDSDQESRTPKKVRTPSKRSNQNDPNSPFKRLRISENASERRGACQWQLAYIREVIQSSRNHGIPNQVDPSTVSRLCAESVEHWRDTLSEFLGTCKRILRSMMVNHIEDAFSTWKGTALQPVGISAVDHLIDRHMEILSSNGDRVYRLEAHKPLTLNALAVEQSRRDALEELMVKRQNFRIEQEISRIESAMGKTFDDREREARKAKLKKEQMPADPHLREIEVVATVRGYYGVAANRFVDHLMQSVQVEFFHACRDEVIPALEEAFGLALEDAHDRCVRLTAENPEREDRRKRLERDEKSLKEARDELQSVLDLS